MGSKFALTKCGAIHETFCGTFMSTAFSAFKVLKFMDKLLKKTFIIKSKIKIGNQKFRALLSLGVSEGDGILPAILPIGLV